MYPVPERGTVRFIHPLLLLLLLSMVVVSPCAVVATEEQESTNDVLGGFDDDSDTITPDLASSSDSEPSERWWDLSGSTSLGMSLNLRNHRSSIGPPPTPAKGTSYDNVQRLRLRGDLQLDLDLPFDWKARAQGFGFYDFAYLAHARSSYTQQVLDAYEYEFEILDLWIEGSIASFLDLKLGRQVVNWGRSDTLRVNDILNPLHNREPGLADIEDLRLPVTMAKADLYIGSWSISAMVIPELRYDKDPVAGNDFFPQLSLGDLPPPGLAPAFAPGVGFGELPDRSESQWGNTPELAGSMTGIFSGWDISLYVARSYQNRTSTIISLPAFSPPSFFRDDDRITMVGTGGNYALGGWLFKAELAFFDELDYVALDPAPELCPLPPDPTAPCIPYTAKEMQRSRLDFMAGVEYYDLTDVTIALEIANRHVIDYDELLRYLPNYVYQDSQELALRISVEMMNTRLELTGLGIVLLADGHHQGSTIRLQADYELMDALTIGGGLLYFIEAESPPFDTWQHNDRLFLKLKYSF